MQHPFRVSLAVALAATSISSLSLAQPQMETRKIETRVMAEMALPSAQIESIDANARTVSLRALKPAPGVAPLETPDGGVVTKMVAGELETVPLAANAAIVRLEFALPANFLKIGDMVSLLGQIAAPGQVKIRVGGAEPNAMQREAGKPQFPGILQNLGGARYGSRVDFLQVIALNPLTLRKGSEPSKGKEESVLSVPFTNGPDSLPIGTVSVGTSEADINLKTRRGDEAGPDIPLVVANYAVTLRLTKTKGLEFDRFTALKLSDVAADFAGDMVSIVPEFSQIPNGKREITRLVVSEIKLQGHHLEQDSRSTER